MYISAISFLLVVAAFAIVLLVIELNKKKELLADLHAENEAGQGEILLLKKALDNLGVVYLAHDIEGTIISVNEEGRRVLHLVPDDVGHLLLSDLLSAEGRLDWENHIRAILQKKDAHGRFRFRFESDEEVVLRYTSVMNLIEEIPVSVHMLAQPEEVILQNKWLDILPVPCFMIDKNGEIISSTHKHEEYFPEKLSNIRHLNEILNEKELKEYSTFCITSKKDEVLELQTRVSLGSDESWKIFCRARNIGDGLSMMCIVPEPHERQHSRPAEMGEERLHNLHGYISAILGFTQILADDLKEQKITSPYLEDILTAGEQALEILDSDAQNKITTADDTSVKRPESIRSHILLVDDDQVLLKMNTIFIQRLGFKAVSARSGSEALEIFNEYMENIALVISDIRILDFSGYALAQKIYELKDDVPVVLISGQVETEKNCAANIYKVLLKPVLPNLLKQVIFGAMKSEEVG